MKLKGRLLGRWEGKEKGRLGGDKEIRTGESDGSMLYAWKCQDESPYYVQFNICSEKLKVSGVSLRK
jgi:hypothetical protein